MKAELKRIHSPDVYDLERYETKGEFCLFVQFIVGLHDGPGEESIDSIVCSPDTCNKNCESKIIIEDRRIIMSTYNYFELKEFVSKFIESFEEDDWRALMRHLSVLGTWEFENYQEYQEKERASTIIVRTA